MNITNIFNEKEQFFHRLSTLMIIGFIYYTCFNNIYIQDIPIEQTIFYIIIVLSLIFLIFYFFNQKKVMISWIILVIPIFFYLIYKRYKEYLLNKENEIKMKHMKEFKETYMNENNVHINEPRPEFIKVTHQGLPKPEAQIPKRYPNSNDNFHLVNQQHQMQPQMNTHQLDLNNYNNSSFTPYDQNFKY